MRDAASALVRKLWQYCNVLRDDGLSYPDYVEQLTYLLFLKMSDEQKVGPVPKEFGWKTLIGLDAPAMHRQYAKILAALGEQSGMLGLIFGNAKNKISDPAKLRLLIVGLIGQTDWTGLSADIKGDAYEGLLEKNARDTKSGAGQYFTPRPLIDAIVTCIAPQLGEVILDPACGTAGFLLAAYEYLLRMNPKMLPKERNVLATQSIRGVELVDAVARLAAMNLLLHGISGKTEKELPISCSDSLKMLPRKKADVVVTNPPFGVKGSITYASEHRSDKSANDLTIVRSDFWVQTANKQLNFVQHVFGALKPGGRAALVLPDNVLFEGGAAKSVRKHLLEQCDVHTLLRLPAGLFYAAGVRANVLFFDKLELNAPNKRSKQSLWVYDLRAEKRFSMKSSPLRSQDLAEFVALYNPGNRRRRKLAATSSRAATRWSATPVDDILKSTEVSLDIGSLAETPYRRRGLSALEGLTLSIEDDLRRALGHVSQILPPKT